MQGTIRTFDDETLEIVKKRINEICTEVSAAIGCTVEVTLDGEYPAVVNHTTETNHVIRLAKEHFGPEHFSQAELPVPASEDFSYFIMDKPGCFFCLGTHKPGKIIRSLHSSDIDYNDDMIATGAYFWVRLVEDRLNIRII